MISGVKISPRPNGLWDSFFMGYKQIESPIDFPDCYAVEIFADRI